jgi:hypothetical protein
MGSKRTITQPTNQNSLIRFHKTSWNTQVATTDRNQVSESEIRKSWEKA